MDCPEIRAQLPLLLYGDVDPSIATSLRAHVAQCAGCAETLERLSRSREALSAWAPIEDPADVGTLAAAGAAFIAERRSARRRPLLQAAYGIAAGILAFAVASYAGTTIEHGDGSLRISFGRTPRERVGPAQDTAALREIVAEEVGERFAASLNQFADLANGWSAAQQERFNDVLRTMQIESDKQSVRETLRTQDLMDGMMQLVALPAQPHRP